MASGFGHTVSCAALTFAVLTAAGASAQDRSGAFGGLSIGGGGLMLNGSADDPAVAIIQQDDEQRAAYSVDLRLGGFASPRLAIFFEGALAFSGETDFDRNAGVIIGDTELQFRGGTTDVGAFMSFGALQFWVARRVWVRGGLGAGSLSRTLYLPDSVDLTLDKGYGFAVLGATGVDVWQFEHGAVDVQVQFTTFSVGGIRFNAPTLQVGVSGW